jgi:hypothetical protein
MVYARPSRESRFWAKVNKNGPIPEDAPEIGPCWLWEGGGRALYGNFWWGKDRGYVYAHQAGYLLQIGPIPPGALICHLCHTRWCVRGEHIYAGSNQSNAADRVRSKRQTRGETHSTAKLSNEAVLAIRDEYTIPGITLDNLAKKYGVTFSNIHAIVARKTWRHL